LRIPVTEGERYRFGDLRFEGNKVVRSEGLRSLYKIEPGEWYNRKKLQDGNKKAQEIYGGAGYMEFTPFPMLAFSDDPNRPERALAAQVPAALAEVQAPAPKVAKEGRRKTGRRPSISRCASTRGRSISSIASRSPAIRRRATTSSAGR
jgi:hypothetical protein